MSDALAILIAALCGVLAYHAHVTATGLAKSIATIDTIAKLAEMHGEAHARDIAELAKRLHAIDRDVGQLCTRDGIKRYGERG